MSTSAISPLASPAAPSGAISKLMVAPTAFTEHRDLMLGTPGLATGSYVITNYAETIWVHEQAFTSWSEAWKCVYQIQNVETRRVCAVDLVSQKIKALNATTKSAAEISNMLQKDFVHLGLDKKELSALRTSLDGYIKAISYCRFSLPSSAY